MHNHHSMGDLRFAMTLVNISYACMQWDHYEEAKNNTAASIATPVPAMIQDNKIMLTSFVTSSSRTTDKQQELIKLLIQTINMNCKWLSLLHNTLKTSTTSSSIFSLAKMSITATNDIGNIQGEITKLENCLDKATTRIADL